MKYRVCFPGGYKLTVDCQGGVLEAITLAHGRLRGEGHSIGLLDGYGLTWQEVGSDIIVSYDPPPPQDDLARRIRAQR